MWVDGEGYLEIPTPEALTSAEVRVVIEEHIAATHNALRAGFDGVELHAANGHLINQFLNPHINRRTDAYGGDLEKRSRFLIELTEGVAAAIGKDNVGVRLSPFSEVNETRLYPEAEATYLHLASALNRLNIAYLHITDQAAIGHRPILADHLRRIFTNTFILSGSYVANNAAEVTWNKQADVLAFGRPFITKPVAAESLPAPLPRPKVDLPLIERAEDYTDYVQVV